MRFVDRDKTVSFKNTWMCCFDLGGVMDEDKRLHLEIPAGE